MRMMSLLAVSLALGVFAGCRSEDKKETPSPKAVEDREPAKQAARPDLAEDRKQVQTTRVTSRDGTQIAFDKTGKGPALVLVSGALSHRAALAGGPLVGQLAQHYTVYIYDRRGRGDSTDVKPYAVEREIEDLEAVVDQAGGSAYVFGVSSGAALAMQAAAKLGPAKVTKVALYEPPYGQPGDAYATQKQRVNELIKTGEPGQAAEAFLGGIGMPPEAIDGMKKSPEWAAIKKLDFTLSYDYEVLGNGKVPADTARAVTVPALVLVGEKTMPFMHPTADELVTLMPKAQRKTLAGQTHQVNADATVPVLIEFFGQG